MKNKKKTIIIIAIATVAVVAAAGLTFGGVKIFKDLQSAKTKTEKPLTSGTASQTADKAIVGASSAKTTAETTTIPELPTVDSNAYYYNKIRACYSEFLRSYADQNAGEETNSVPITYTYGFFDLDGDGTQELILCKTEIEVNSPAYIYSYDKANDDINCIGKLADFRRTYIVQDGKLLSFYAKMGSGSFSTYSMKDGLLEINSGKSNEYDSYPDLTDYMLPMTDVSDTSLLDNTELVKGVSATDAKAAADEEEALTKKINELVGIAVKKDGQQLPKLLINTQAAQNINQQILKNHKDEADGELYYSYKAYLYKNILSLRIQTRYDGGMVQFTTYCVDKDTGELMNKQELLEQWGISENDFNTSAGQAIEAEFNARFSSNHQMNAETFSKFKENAVKSHSLNKDGNALYIDDLGNLCFSFEHRAFAGPEYNNTIAMLTKE